MAGRKAVMVADDDVLMDTCAINRHAGGSSAGQAWRVQGCARTVSSLRDALCTPAPNPSTHPSLPLSSHRRAFEVFTAYGLLLGQPSLCPTQHRPSW